MDATAAVEELQEQIGELVCERQDLRTYGASSASLEQNRLELVRSQWDLSQALIQRHAPAASRADRLAAALEPHFRR